jgi:hypothetical protein
MGWDMKVLDRMGVLSKKIISLYVSERNTFLLNDSKKWIL